jgi:hypothetical protein
VLERGNIEHHEALRGAVIGIGLIQRRAAHVAVIGHDRKFEAVELARQPAESLRLVPVLQPHRVPDLVKDRV